MCKFSYHFVEWSCFMLVQSIGCCTVCYTVKLVDRWSVLLVSSNVKMNNLRTLVDKPRADLINPFCSSYLNFFFFGEIHLNMLKLFLKKKKKKIVQWFGFYKMWNRYKIVTSNIHKYWILIMQLKILICNKKLRIFSFISKKNSSFLDIYLSSYKNLKHLLHKCNIRPKRVKKNLNF